MTMTLPTPAPDRKATVFRLDPDNLEWLDAYAQRTRRSRNGAVNYLIQQAREREAGEATTYPAYTDREREQDREGRAFDDPPNFPGEAEPIEA